MFRFSDRGVALSTTWFVADAEGDSDGLEVGELVGIPVVGALLGESVGAESVDGTVVLVSVVGELVGELLFGAFVG